MGIGIGVMRAGILGGILSFIGFTLPSVIALVLFAYILQDLNMREASWIHGLKIVAVVVVAHAILGMVQKLIPDLHRKAIALFSLVGTLLWQTVFTQVAVICLSGLIGYYIYKKQVDNDESKRNFPISRKEGFICLSLFFWVTYFPANPKRNYIIELDCNV